MISQAGTWGSTVLFVVVLCSTNRLCSGEDQAGEPGEPLAVASASNEKAYAALSSGNQIAGVGLECFGEYGLTC